MLDIIRLSMLSMGNNGLPRPISFERVSFPRAMMSCHARRSLVMYAFQDDDGMPRSISSDCVCFPRTMMAYHARRRTTVYAAQGR